MRFLHISPLLIGAVVLSLLSAPLPGRADMPPQGTHGFSQNVSSKGGSLRPTEHYGVDPYASLHLMPIVWEPDPAKPISRIEVQLAECKLFVYQGDGKDEHVVGATSISCGREGYETRPGTFTVTQKDKDHHSNMYGSFVNSTGHIVNDRAEAGQDAPSGTHYEAAPMLWFLRITDTGTGLHAGYVTGTPVSHGCIRLPPSFAEDLYGVAQIGTRVDIKP